MAKKVLKKKKSNVVSINGGDAPEQSGMVVDKPSVYVSVGKTINIGNFESLRVDYGERHLVGTNQDFEEVRESATASVIQAVQDMIAEVQETFED